MQCPICDVSNNENDFIKTFTASFNNQEYKLYHCAGCNLEFWSPLKIIPEFYEKIEVYSLRRLGVERTADYQIKNLYCVTLIKNC